MPILRLTDANVLSHKPASADTWLFDSVQSGFCCRVRKGVRETTRQWYATWEFAGKGHKMMIGTAGALPCVDARAEAGRLLTRARQGDNPLVAKRKEAERIRGQIKFSEAVDRFLIYQKVDKGNRPNSLRDQTRALRKYCAGWANLPVDEIDQSRVKALLTRLKEEVGVPTYISVKSSVSALFVWLMTEGIAKANPTVGLAKVKAPEARKRWLNTGEIVELWDATSDLTPFSRIVRLLALLGLRRNEVAGAHWSEINLDEALWIIPAERMKNREEHRVLLSEQALRLLPERPAEGGPVFSLFTSFSNQKMALDGKLARARKAAGIEPMENWRVHDLRRVMATNMAERLNILPHIIEECLSHKSHRTGVAGKYNLAKYDSQKKSALQAWGDYVEALTDGTVVELKRSA